MYKRNCKRCGKEVIHKDEKNLKRAIKLNKICSSCSNSIKAIGEKNSMYGKKHTEETKQKIKEKRKLQTFSKETIEKLSIASKRRCEEFNHWIGRKHKEDTIKKMRTTYSKKMVDNKWHPSFNITACEIIEKYGKKYGYDFQHAMNGGEFFIEELGYWVDGYDRNKNTVIEYYEKSHLYSIERDEKRIKDIEEHLKCNVIILKE